MRIIHARRPRRRLKANGAGKDGPGPVAAGTMLFVNAGGGGPVGRPGNVLLAFGLE